MTTNTWPNNNQCCVCLTFDLDAEWVFMGNHPETANMPRRLSLGAYVWKAKIIPRILSLLKKHKVKATFFVVGINAENHPDTIEEIYSKGHELACHGWKHEKITHLTKEEEEKRLLKTAEAIRQASGFKPIGNRTAGGELSPNTHDILMKNGFLYDSSLRNCDLPYIIKSSGNSLVIVPSYYEMDDFHLFADYPGTVYHARMMSPQTGYEIWTNAFDGYYKYGLCYTTMFHPQIIGKPGNMMLLEKLLDYIKKHNDVWFATAEEIARFWINRK